LLESKRIIVGKEKSAKSPPSMGKGELESGRGGGGWTMAFGEKNARLADSILKEKGRWKEGKSRGSVDKKKGRGMKGGKVGVQAHIKRGE